MTITRRVLLGGTLAQAWGCGPVAPPSLAHPLANGQAPRFIAETTDHFEVGIPSVTGAQKTLLVFFAPWCGTCRKVLPAFAELDREVGSSGLEMLAIAIDASPAQARATLEQAGASFPLLVDLDGRLSSSYSVNSVPMAFLIDRNEHVAWVGRYPEDARDAVNAR